MQITVDNDIRIKNPTEQVRAWAKSYLVVGNPEYYKKVKLGKWTGNTPQNIWLYEERSDGIVIPFGCFQKLWEMCRDKSAYTCDIKPTERRNYKSLITLYPYQERAAEAIIRAKNGILVMPCGSGKTQTGLEVIARLGGRALWLTHTQDLLNQSMNRAKSVLEIDGTLGKITEGKVDIGSHITFATVQTMCNIDLPKYKDCFDVIIVDECQHCCGTPTRVTQFYKVISSLSARYKIGLTATPKRADGLERSMFALLGSVAYGVTRQDVKDTTCPVWVEQIETGYEPDYDAVLCGDGTLDYSKIVDDMIHNEARFEFVSEWINDLSSSMIVLANRVEYIQRLCDAYNGRAVCLSTMGTSKKAKERRKQVLKQLDDGDIDAVFATYQLAKEGLDVPSLRYVVFSTPEKDETTVIQSAGRVGRKAEGKERGIVVDFCDNFGMYRGWQKKRKGYYKKIDATFF